VQTREAILTVPGARLYYKVRGSGPLLLVLQGGPGDADASDGIVDRLLGRFTVVTYDRRGLSRSRLDEGAEPPSTLETHSDDVFRLLTSLADEPVLAIGHSLGAVIALDLVARHPEAVRVLVAHEPSVAQMLPDEERVTVERARQDMLDAHHHHGISPALKKLAAMVGADPSDREPGIRRSRTTPCTAANLAFFFSHDVPASRRHLLDLGALAAARTQIIFIAGSSSQGAWPRRATELLAKRLDKELLEFPGDHDGFAMHPRAFATRFLEILEGSTG